MNRTGFSRVSDVTQTRWIPGCPVEVEQGVLLLDEGTQEVILQLSIRNVGNARVDRVELLVRRLDREGNLMEGVDEATSATYGNIHVPPGHTFGSRKSIPLGAKGVRDVRVIFSRVVQSGGVAWENQRGEEGRLNDAPLLEEALGPDARDRFMEEYRRSSPGLNLDEGTAGAIYMPVAHAHAWNCTCGFINLDTMPACGRCNMDREWLFAAARGTHPPQKNSGDAESFWKDMERQRRIRTEEKQRLIKELKVFQEKTKPVRQEKGNQKYNRKKALVAILFFNLVIALLVYLLLRTIF